VVTRTTTYDGLAEWYDQYVGGSHADEGGRLVRRLLGLGPGRLLDQGCGGGRFFELFAELGWSPVGVDLSADQLRIAQRRADAVGAELVQGDATELPFADEEFDAVVQILVSTDIEPFERLVGEAARVLKAGGVFVHVGTHPCFVGPHSMLGEDEGRLIGPGYRERRRQFDLPAYKPTGVRRRAGAVHVPLDDMLNGLVAAGLELELVVESQERDPPLFFGLRAAKRAPS
jgi:SAM-dependent methyltransferase